MSAELQTLHSNHESHLQQEQLAHQQLLEEALVEQHNDHEQDIARRNEAIEGEREAWEAERAAHEAEVQALQDQLNLERGELEYKLGESNTRVKELVALLEAEQSQAKVSCNRYSLLTTTVPSREDKSLVTTLHNQ